MLARGEGVSPTLCSEGHMKRPPRGGWDGADQAKRAAEYQISYGHGLVRKHSAGWPDYVAVTTPSAYLSAERYLAKPPAGVGYVDLLDFGQLQAITDSLPDDVDLVVGIGAGRALDASKYVALKMELPLLIVPTVVSTGAIIHGFLARWEGRKLLGNAADWPWIDFEDLLVDYDLTLEAPTYLNTAGLGDVLCGYAGLAEWRRNSRLGVGPPWDADAAASALQHHDQIVREFPRTLDSKGGLTADSIRFIMTAVQERDERSLVHPAAPSGDHAFPIIIELANDKGWVHGELVALAAIIIAWQCEESPDLLISRLDRCQVRRRPSEMGMTYDELLRGLEAAPEHMRRQGLDSIMGRDPVTGRRFDLLWEFLETT